MRLVSGDLRNRDELRSVLKGPNAVVRFTANARVMDRIEDPVNNFESNVIGTFKPRSRCRELDVHRIVAASTGRRDPR